MHAVSYKMKFNSNEKLLAKFSTQFMHLTACFPNPTNGGYCL